MSHQGGHSKGRLPPKEEYVIYTPLTRSQKEFCGGILDEKGHQLLGKMFGDNCPASEELPVVAKDGKIKAQRQSRKDAVDSLVQKAEAEPEEESETSASLLSPETKEVDAVESEEDAAANLSKTELDAILDQRLQVSLTM